MIVDAHEIVRVGLRELLSQRPDLELIAESASAASGVTEAIRLAPDLVLTDMQLPDDSGIAVCRKVHSACPVTKVVFYSAAADRESVLAALSAGADGYLLKQGDGDRLVSALQEVAKGRAVLDPAVTGIVLEQIRSMTAGAHKTRPIALSAMEHQVLALVAQGRTNQEIATALQLSHKTVKRHLSNVFQKIGVTRRSEAAAHFVITAKSGPNGRGR